MSDDECYGGSGSGSISAAAEDDERFLKPYDLRMSSKYSSCSNRIESLNDEDGLSGVCTDKEEAGKGFIQVSFLNPVTISRMMIGCCNMEGWGVEYLEGSTVEYLDQRGFGFMEILWKRTRYIQWASVGR